MNVATREPQYDACFREPVITLGPMAGSTWQWNPRRLGMVLARYKFVSKMLTGLNVVAEIGCADGFASEVVRREVGSLHLFDFDPAWMPYASRHGVFSCHDIVEKPLPSVAHRAHINGPARLNAGFDAIYTLDTLEHIEPGDEPRAMTNICASLSAAGVFIAGMPSLESQVYAAPISRAGHVNCKTGDELLALGRHYFDSAFLFGMNDEVLHTGFSAMCHYLFVLCTGPRRRHP